MIFVLLWIMMFQISIINKQAKRITMNYLFGILPDSKSIFPIVSL